MSTNPEVFTKRYFQLPREEIGYLRFILESYDGLGFARTLENRQALVEIASSASRESDVAELLLSLADEIGLQEVPPPRHIPPL